MNIDKQMVNRICSLYINQGLSAKDIGNRIGKTTWQVLRIMKAYHIPRRSPQETQALQFIKKPLSFHKKMNLNPNENALYHAGLLLYWAEGVKAKNTVVDFTNSDKQMVRIFLKFLRVIFQVKESRLRVLLYCYANQGTQKLISYWSQLLNIPPSQFIKPYVRHDFDVQKSHKMPHGLVHIRYNDKKLFMQIMSDLAIISNELFDGWDGGAANRTCL